LWYDSDKPELFGSYKLPIATISDGRLVAVPRAIFAAAAAVRGARGGVDVPTSDLSGIRRHINRYYSKMGLESPFAGSKDVFRVDDLSILNERIFEEILKSGVKFGNKISKVVVSVIKAAKLRDEKSGDRDGDMTDILSEIKKINELIKR
jgi:hypothetical protein